MILRKDVTGCSSGKDDDDLTSLAQRLAGSLGVKKFNAEVREKTIAVFKGAFDAPGTEALMSLDTLERLLDGPASPIATTDIFAGDHIVRLGDIHHRSRRSVTSVAAEHLAKGATLRVRDIQAAVPELAGFARAVARVFAAQTQINLYLTPPAQAGFPPHFDNTDVFVLQIAGTKTWSVYQDYTNRVPLPDPNVAWDPDRFCPKGAPDTHLLEVGDVLYLPRGEMHAAECTDLPSLHLTISLTSLTTAEVLQREISRLAEEEPALRARADWDVEQSSADDARLKDSLRSVLYSLADRIDPVHVIAREKSRLAGSEDQEDESVLVETLDRLARDASK